MNHYNRKNRGRPEILAPLPNLSQFHLISGAGAHRLYTGVRGFSREGAASSPTYQELLSRAKSEPSLPPRLHLALNIVPSAGKEEQILHRIGTLVKAGYGQFIVNDHALLNSISRAYPGISLCGSVGLGSINPYDALFLGSAGASSIVLPTFATPDDVRAIKRVSPLGVEVFAYCRGEPLDQGSCMLTGYLLPSNGRTGKGNVRSAKLRGVCHTLCRKIIDESSPHDITDRISDWIDAGVDIFKIEGRYRTVDEIIGMVERIKRVLDSTTR